MKKETSIIKMFPQSLRGYFRQIAREYEELSEIRIRCNKPVIILRNDGEFYVTKEGERKAIISQDRLNLEKEALQLGPNQLEDIFVYLCQYSPYAFSNELRQGFLTVAGGHRIGVAGQVVMEASSVKGMRNIRFINMRISHEVLGISNVIFDKLHEGEHFCNTLLMAEPAGGKTTMLRDLIRQLSNGTEGHPGKVIGVVDERSEIAGCFLGEPQNDLGIRADVLDACPKVYGMEMLLRSMNPDVIAVDEIATPEEVDTLKLLCRCGIGILATIHAGSVQELEGKEFLKPLLNMGCFQRFVLLRQKAVVGVYNWKGEMVL